MVCVREAWGRGEDSHLSAQCMRVLSPACLLYTLLFPLRLTQTPSPSSLKENLHLSSCPCCLSGGTLGLELRQGNLEGRSSLKKLLLEKPQSPGTAHSSSDKGLRGQTGHS